MMGMLDRVVVIARRIRARENVRFKIGIASLGTAILIMASIAPAKAMSDNDDTSKVIEFLDFMSVAAVCNAIGYPIEAETATSKIKDLTERAIRNSSNPASTMQLIEGHYSEISGRSNEAMSVLEQSGEETVQKLEALDSLVVKWVPVCDAYTANPEYMPYIGQSVLQKSGLPQTGYNYVRLQAEDGRTTFMVVLADLHRLGLGEPDSSHHIEFEWMKRAASAGDADAAFITAGNYFTAYGTEKNNVEAEKWWAVALALGYKDDGAIAIMEQDITAAEIAVGRSAAHQWLIDKEYDN